MKIFYIDEKTQLPLPTAEALLIDSFDKIWKRTRKIDGDADGRKKTFNKKELGYIYYQGVYDSRFKRLTQEEKEKKVRELLGLPEIWKPDEVVEQAIIEYVNIQITTSSEIVASLEGTGSALAKYLVSIKDKLATGAINVKEVKDIMDIINGMPTTLDSILKAKAVLEKEQNALLTGRKGRSFNKFEMKD
jgi:hypothetical protein